MRLQDDIDFTTLNWVKQELDETLKQARQALEAFVEDPSDTSQMRFCATYLHQVQGTLSMVELYGAALVVEEMEAVSLGLLEESISKTDEAYAVLMRGIVQLPDYLERLQSGHRDIPVVLLPLLNDLRAARGQELLSETALFSPDLSRPLPASAAGPAKPIPDRTLRVAAAKLRKAFEMALVRWFKYDDEGLIARLKVICEKLRSITDTVEARRLWWVASGVLEGLLAKAIESNMSVKLLFGKLDREIKRMALKGEKDFEQRPPNDVVKGLLYYAAHAEAKTTRLKELKSTYDLDALLPDVEELEHARGAIAGHNRELLATVSGAIKEDLMKVKESLDLKVRQNDTSAEGMEELAENLARVADTLGMLGMGVPRQVVLDQRDVMQAIRRGDEQIVENTLLDIAGSLLYVESSLDDHIEQMGASTEGGGPEDGESELPRSEVRRILDALMKEASGNLQKIKQNIVEFIEAPWDHARVSETPRLLDEIVGALRMLDLSEAAGLLNGIVAYTRVELLGKRAVPSAEQLDTMADAVASLEYYLEAVREHRPGRDKILAVAEASLRQLGYFGEGGARALAAFEAEHPTPEPEPEPKPKAAPSPSAGTLAGTSASDGESIELSETVGLGDMPSDASQPAAVASKTAAGAADISDEIDDEIREVFIEEVEEELANLNELYPKWKANLEDQETLATIRRTFHTLKGSGRLVGAYTIGEFSWSIENMLNRVLDGSIEAAAGVFSVMDRAVAALPQLLANVKGEGQPTIDIEHIKQVAEKVTSGDEVDVSAKAPSDAATVVVTPATDPGEAKPAVAAPLEPQTSAELESPSDFDFEAGLSESESDALLEFETTLPPEAPETAGADSELDFEISFDNDDPADDLDLGFESVADDSSMVSVDMGDEIATHEDLAFDESFASDSTDVESEVADQNFASGADPGIDFSDFFDQPEVGEEATEAEESLSTAVDVPLDVGKSTDDTDSGAAELVLEAEEEDLGSAPIDPVLLGILRSEVHGHVDVIRSFLSETAESQQGVAASEALLRAVHTLNGAIAMVDLPELATVTGPLEGYVKRLRLGNQAPSAAGLAAIEQSVAAVEEVVRHLENGSADFPNSSALSQRLHSLRDELPEPGSLSNLFPVDEIADAGFEEDDEQSAEAELSSSPESTVEIAPEQAGNKEDAASVSETYPADLISAAEPAEGDSTAIQQPDDATLAEAGEPQVSVPSRGVTRDIDEVATFVPPAERPRSEPSVAEVVPAVADEEIALRDLGDIDEELLEIFLQEGAEILDAADHKMAQWREAPNEREPVTELQRELHTLKGGARMAGLTPIGDLSHAMESLFEGIVADEVKVSARTVEVMERAFDRLHNMIARVAEKQPIPSGKGLVMAIDALLSGAKLSPAAVEERTIEEAAAKLKPKTKAKTKVVRVEPERPTALDQADQRGAPARPQQELIRVRADLLDNLVNYAGEVSIYRSRLEQQIGTFRFNLVEFDQTVHRLREQLRNLEIETETQIIARFQREADEMDETFDPLELDRFSTLQQLSRALAESVSDLVSIQGMLDDLTRQSETLLLQQSRVNSDLQEGLMRTRMVPFDSLVPRLRRILRQTSQELNKKAHLRVDGAQGEMDRTVLERITAPLEHMLRNAVAHGLEGPEDRAAAGKAEEGSIRMAISREATEVVIRVTDDGEGIDPGRVRAKAIERGLLHEDAHLSERDLYGFILEAGFSTAEEISKVAGRGVGMDVVNSEIKQLGGSLDIASQRGEGTTFTIRLPFTLAVTHAIMARVGEHTFAIPLSSIQGVVRMSRSDFDERIERDAGNYEYTGESYQLKELAVLLGLDRRDHGDEEMVPVLMSRIADQRAAIRVDGVMGSREIVVKSVGPQISSIPGIFGATILGDGSVVMILDIGPLIRRGVALQLTADSDEDDVVVEEVIEDVRVPLVMVVDDSITMRKVTTRVLQRHAMEVITAKDGVDAVEQLQDRVPDLMLLDIEMPRMDGYELATHMRNDHRLKSVPIIMITSRTGEKHRERAMEIGVNRYLGKPYQEAELLTNVRELLGETVDAD